MDKKPQSRAGRGDQPSEYADIPHPPEGAGLPPGEFQQGGGWRDGEAQVLAEDHVGEELEANLWCMARC